MRKLGFVALLLLIGLGACEYEALTRVELKPAERDVSYKNDVQPLFDANCKLCHSGGQSPMLKPPDSYNALVGGDYIDVNNPLESKLLVKILEPHPKDDPLSQEDKGVILKWIMDGANNN